MNQMQQEKSKSNIYDTLSGGATPNETFAELIRSSIPTKENEDRKDRDNKLAILTLLAPQNQQIVGLTSREISQSTKIAFMEVKNYCLHLKENNLLNYTQEDERIPGKWTVSDFTNVHAVQAGL